MLHLDKKIEAGGDLVTKKPYHGFELKFEWKITEGCNSGVKMAEVDYGSDDWKARFAKSKYRKTPSFASRAGSLLLQDHGNDVWYRNLWVKEL